MSAKSIGIAGVVVGSVLAYAFWPTDAGAGESTPATDLFAAQRGDLRITITENGTMVAKESQKVKTKIRGESKIQFLVEEGKEVEQDEVVCRLDATKVEEGIEQIELEILQTEASLKTARTELEIQTVEAAAAIAKAKVAEDRAQKEIEKYRDGEAPQERRKLEVSLKDTQTKFVRAKKDVEDSKDLLAQKYITQSDYEDTVIAFESAQVQQESAQVALKIFDKYTFPMAITDLETKLADAMREVTTAEKRGEAKLGQKKVSVQQVEKRLKVQRKSLKERREDLGNMTLKAPCPGIVVYGNPNEPWYRDRIKVGNQVYRGFTVMTIPDLRVMQVNLDVHEADISKLKEDLPATITTDSYPGVVMKGKVSKIAAVASSNSNWGGQSEVKQFRVQVTLEAGEVQLRPGISAKVEIRVETREATLFVPLQSVFTEDGVSYCHVEEGTGPPARRAVKIGTSNDTYLEILEGVEEGEKVLLFNPHLTRSGPATDASEAAGEEDAASPSAEARAGNAGKTDE